MFLDVDHRAANTPVYLQSRESTQELSVQPPNPGQLKLSRPPNTNSIIQRHPPAHRAHTHTDTDTVRCGGISQKRVNKSGLCIISRAYIRAARPLNVAQKEEKMENYFFFLSACKRSKDLSTLKVNSIPNFSWTPSLFFQVLGTVH